MVEPVLTLEDDLAVARHLADVAARVALASFGPRHAVTMKADATPVTEVDVAAERAIRDEVARIYPRDGILGEEGGDTAGESGREWIVDPIDGTKLYAEGIPLWTTLVALRAGGELVLGVADAPALGERVHATRGGGAWRGTERLAVSRVDRLADAFVVLAPLEEWAATGDVGRIAQVATAARGTRGLSDAWGQLLVARGSADGHVEHDPCFEWDWAATSVIVEEAGGRVTAPDGSAPVAGRPIVVSNGLVHDELLAALNGGSSV